MQPLRTAILFLLPVLFVSGCGRTFDWHQRIQIVIDTPQGEVVAEAVQAVEVVYIPKWMRLGGFERSYEMRGEAVVADLGAGRYLFVLLADEMLAERVLPVDRSDAPGYLRRIEQMAGDGSYPIPPNRYPLLVAFDDISDPATVRRVDPADLESIFGRGFSLKSVTLEVTGEPVTEGRIEEVLRWWCEYKNKRARLNGSTSIGISTNDLPDVIGPGAFRIGDCR